MVVQESIQKIASAKVKVILILVCIHITTFFIFMHARTHTPQFSISTAASLSAQVRQHAANERKAQPLFLSPLWEQKREATHNTMLLFVKLKENTILSMQIRLG